MIPSRWTIVLALMAVLVTALAACDENAAGPDPDPRVRVHVAHAAPGTGTYDVHVNSNVVVEGLAVRNTVVDTVEPGEQHVAVEGPDGSFEVTERVTSEALGVVLVDAGPRAELRHYVNAGTGGTPGLVVINALPETTVGMLVDFDPPRYRNVLGPGEALQLDHNTGVFRVEVYEQGMQDDPVVQRLGFDLARVSFVVIYADPDGPAPWSVLAF